MKYLLGLELKHQGFHHSALGAFRARLVENGAEARLLEELLAVCRARGFVKAGGRQRTDSTPVVAAVKSLNRLECVHETLRLALERVAELEPEWLQAQVPVEWYEWYGRRLDASQMAKSAAEKERWQVRIGESGRQLLLAVQDARTPAYLRQLPAPQLLQMRLDPAVLGAEGPHPVALTQHSYRAGLWDAATFATHHWAEACRRGVDNAKAVVCVSDGAAWIWAIVFMCFAVRIEILDWWHAVQRLWTIANDALHL